MCFVLFFAWEQLKVYVMLCIAEQLGLESNFDMRRIWVQSQLIVLHPKRVYSRVVILPDIQQAFQFILDPRRVTRWYDVFQRIKRFARTTLQASQIHRTKRSCNIA